MSAARTSVFISYSHADTKWRDLLLKHLYLLIRNQKVKVWSDLDIRKGERWRARIKRELAQARVGIFLVSADFLASDFIHAVELPPLLAAADQEGATLLSIIVRPCPFEDSPLAHLQTMNNPRKPLSGLSPTEREQAMVKVYNELRGLFRLTPSSKAPAVKTPKKPAATPGANVIKAIARRKAIEKKKQAATPSRPKATSTTVSKTAPARPTTRRARRNP